MNRSFNILSLIRSPAKMTLQKNDIAALDCYTWVNTVNYRTSTFALQLAQNWHAILASGGRLEKITLREIFRTALSRLSMVAGVLIQSLQSLWLLNEAALQSALSWPEHSPHGGTFVNLLFITAQFMKENFNSTTCSWEQRSEFSLASAVLYNQWLPERNWTNVIRS